MLTVIQILLFLLSVLWWLIVLNAVLSLLFAFNVLNHSNSGVRAFMESLDRLLEPLYRPFRKILPNAGGVDWSPFLVLITIGVIQIVLRNVAYSV